VVCRRNQDYSKDGSAPKKQDKPFYDGIQVSSCHRQLHDPGGDPQGTGGGGPGYTFKDECLPNSKHDKPGHPLHGQPRPEDQRSQFFITHKDTPWLDGKHTIFGHVVEGQDVVNKIAGGDTINSIKILRIGDKAKAFKGDQGRLSISFPSNPRQHSGQDAKAGATDRRLGFGFFQPAISP